jgi:dTDP-4-dehydrorhamnose reductase
MICLLGGSGYVGTAFRRYLDQQGFSYANLSRSEVDYTQTAELLRRLLELKPDFLINCAGYTGKPTVDACEENKAECLFGNAVLPGRIAEACAETGIPMGHVSSGCIYNGTAPRRSGFREGDPPNFCFRRGPCSFYSGSKALGEEMLEGYENVYIWRVRIPFNDIDGPRNYLSKLMRYAKVLDATNSISQLDEFVAAALGCYQERLPYGTYHMTNPGAITAREIVALIQRYRLSEKDFAFFEDEDAFMREAAKTPRSNCILDSGKLYAHGIQLTEAHQAVEEAIRNWQA